MNKKEFKAFNIKAWSAALLLALAVFVAVITLSSCNTYYNDYFDSYGKNQKYGVFLFEGKKFYDVCYCESFAVNYDSNVVVCYNKFGDTTEYFGGLTKYKINVKLIHLNDTIK